MLVLSRQRDETIMIGDDVEITVVDIRGDKVRLGITAPRHIQVHRKEVYDAIKRENRQAANLSPQDVSEVIETDAGPKAAPAPDVGPVKEGSEKDRAKQVRRSRG
jgi:carbon storage regulator